MLFYSTKYKRLLCLIVLSLMVFSGFSQSETSKWKLQIAFGVNLPEDTGFIIPYEPKPLNFPTINLGVQHLFTRELGAKLDFGYNRFSNADNAPEFKTNYTRLNVQFVYDATRKLYFLPPRMGVVGHIGPGFTFMKPLGNFTNNKQTYLNVLAGIEIHYGITDTVSVFSDLSYIYGLGGDITYDPPSEGFGAFRGSVFTVSFGISVSLSGCQYCD